MMPSRFSSQLHKKPAPFFFITGFLLLLIFPGKVLAEHHYRSATQYPVDFSLAFSHTNQDLEDNSRTYAITQRRISASLFQIMSPNLRSGVNIGSTFLGLDNDAATSQFDLNGSHIGFTVKGITGKNPRLGLRGHYLYQELKGDNDLRSATLSWLEWHVEASLEMDLGSYWTLSTGAGLVGIDARRRVKGDINNTLKLKQDAAIQGWIGIDLNTHPDGRITLVLSRGINNGARLAFAREF